MSDTDYNSLGPEVSKYNEAFAKLQRIGGLWSLAHVASINRNFSRLNAILDEIWKELAADVKEGEAEEKRMNGFNVELAKLKPLALPGSFGFNKVPQDYKEKLAKQYTVLTEKEIYLRRLQNKLGMGTKLADLHEDEVDM